MAFKDDVQERVETILNEEWKITTSKDVPSTNDVAHKNGAVRIEAAFLYADLAASTDLQKRYVDTFAAKAIRMYLGGASSIIRHFEGTIKSFDGDRVMGVFTGDSRRNNAVKAGFMINWLVLEVIAPLVRARQEAMENTAVWIPSHGVGIDEGEAFVTRAGVRNKAGEHNHNDLIFVGRAPNVAAKLSALRGDGARPLIITRNVYRFLNDGQKKYLQSEEAVWSDPTETQLGPYNLALYRTGYWRSR